MHDGLSRALVPFSKLELALQEFICDAPQIAGFGYQQSISDLLPRFLHERFTLNKQVQSASTRISPRLNENADLALAKHLKSRCVFIEIEFRPNVEKDLVKFQIAANRGLLEVGVLIVALSRADINPAYTTMPEFAKTVRIIEELEPAYPLVVFGIAGRHLSD